MPELRTSGLGLQVWVCASPASPIELMRSSLNSGPFEGPAFKGFRIILGIHKATVIWRTTLILSSWPLFKTVLSHPIPSLATPQFTSLWRLLLSSPVDSQSSPRRCDQPLRASKLNSVPGNGRSHYVGTQASKPDEHLKSVVD